MLTPKVVGVEGGREPACSEFPSAFVVSIVPTQRQFTLGQAFIDKSKVVLALLQQESMDGLLFLTKVHFSSNGLVTPVLLKKVMMSKGIPFN